MKIYDTHSDIFSNLYERNLKGEKDIFQNYHINPLRTGEVIGGIWVVYSEHDFDVDNKNKTMLMCAVPTRRYCEVKNTIEKIDEDVFFLITDTYEIHGGV